MTQRRWKRGTGYIPSKHSNWRRVKIPYGVIGSCKGDKAAEVKFMLAWVKKTKSRRDKFLYFVVKERVGRYQYIRRCHLQGNLRWKEGRG